MTRSSRVLILLNGEVASPAAVRQAARDCGAVLCADGGARYAARLGLKPRLILGDMDSLPRRLPGWRDTVYLCDFDPDSSDFDKALRFAAERGFAEAWVAGGLGGSIDHALVNLAVAERYWPKVAVRFIGGPEARLCGRGSHRLACRTGQRVTLLAVDARCRLSTRGLRYPVKDAWLERGSRGLSNVATAAQIRLQVRQGRLWAIH